jgi:hypothetical protein
MTLPLEHHGLKCTKMHLFSLFVAALCACSLTLVALSVIEPPPIIIDQGMTLLSCLSTTVLPDTPNRALGELM